MRDGSQLTALLRAPDGSLRQQTGSTNGTWSATTVNLGGPTNGQFLGQPAAHGSAGGRIDLFVRGTDNSVYTRVFSGGAWGPYTPLEPVVK